ncbi:MFS transporter [Actinoplanes sp. NPDC051346]|uniref:MFS transporter n=1 Tax=Actinoplanes sp. NPDC051346 TaxID=3155048 RepID=UPI0034211FC9
MGASRHALLVVFLAQGACFATLVSRIPALRDRYALGDLGLGLVLALVPLIAGIGSLAADRVARRRGVVPVLRVATPTVCVVLAVVAVVGSLPALVAVLAVFGLALGAADVTINAYGVAVQRAGGRPIMSAFHAAYSLGGILGSVTAATAAARHLPLTAHFGAVAAAASLACAVAGRRLSPAFEPTRRDPEAVVPRLWRRITVVGAAMTALFLTDSAVSNWGAGYLRDVLGAPDHVAALVYGGYAAATLLGRTVGDVAVDRFGGARVAGAGGVLAAAGMSMVVTAATPATGLAGFAVVGCGLSVIAPLAFTAAGRAVPELPTAAVARVNLCVYAGFVLGAPLVGMVASLASPRAAFAVTLVIILGVIAAAPKLGR